MADPATHEARMDAGRRGVICGSDVDVTEDAIFAALAGEDEADSGAWLLGERGPA